ncbi:unnamed protein product [Prorocentrum cordatum]|uniref:Uncharacterized protein n=1 Tax=Prorocentrum cordatum TaxID=2364126 RepID=A0ABN9VGI6_9DINO|nr:unnamed protein product [Polarella glacialis]
MQNAGAACAAAAQGEGKGRGPGPPARTTFAQLAKQLITEEVGDQSRDTSESAMQQCSERESWDIVRTCHACRLERCHDESKVEIARAVDWLELQKVIRLFLGQIGELEILGLGMSRRRVWPPAPRRGTLATPRSAELTWTLTSDTEQIGDGYHGGHVMVAGSQDGVWVGTAHMQAVDFVSMGKFFHEYPALYFKYQDPSFFSQSRAGKG